MRKNEIDLSIVIPVYNVQSYISETILNVANQNTSYNYEVILIDDGSTDDTVKVINGIISGLSNFKLCLKENGGAGSARNLGIREAAGNYILFLDSDDLIKPTLIEETLSISYADNLDMYLFSASIFSNHNMTKSFNYQRKDSKVISGIESLQDMFKSNKYIISPCLYITKLTKIKKFDIFFPQNIIYEDSYFTFFNIVTANRIKITSQIYYYRRVRAGSVMTTRNRTRSFNSSAIVFELISRDIDSYGYIPKDVQKKILFRQFRGAVSEYYKMSKFEQKILKNSVLLKNIIECYSVYGSKLFASMWVKLVSLKHAVHGG